MQLPQNPSLRRTLVTNETGSSLISPQTAVLGGTITQPVSVWPHGQSGVGADHTAQTLDHLLPSIITPLIEQDILDNKMMNWNPRNGIICPSGFTSLVEDAHEDPPTGSLSAAIFDVQMDLSVDINDFPSPEGTLASLGVTDLMNSVLPSESPRSPSEFLHKEPPPQDQSSDLPPDLKYLIEEVLPTTSSDENFDSSLLDLELFEHSDSSNVLESLVRECGIDEKIEEESSDTLGESGFNIIPTFTIQQEVTAAPSPQPLRDSVGPLRVRRERRASKKPARFRDAIYLDEASATTVSVSPEEAEENTTNTTTSRRRGNRLTDLSNEEKYIRSREQNNLASRRCREKRKENFEKMQTELSILEERNKVLKDKEARLAALRDEFHKFVNDFLFKQMKKK